MNRKYSQGDWIVINQAGKDYLIECLCRNWIPSLETPNQVVEERGVPKVYGFNGSQTKGWFDPWKDHFDLVIQFESEWI